jgi:hypothetical protein
MIKRTYHKVKPFRTEYTVFKDYKKKSNILIKIKIIERSLTPYVYNLQDIRLITFSISFRDNLKQIYIMKEEQILTKDALGILLRKH